MERSVFLCILKPKWFSYTILLQALQRGVKVNEKWRIKMKNDCLNRDLWEEKAISENGEILDRIYRIGYTVSSEERNHGSDNNRRLSQSLVTLGNLPSPA
jgi:hypothetical protein